MNNLFKKIGKYTLLFFALYVCSIVVVNIFVLFGATYTNMYNTAYIATLFAFVLLLAINRLYKRTNISM